MLFVFFETIGVYKNAIDKYNDKLIQILVESSVHEVHKSSWHIGESKRHDREIVVAIVYSESGLRDILLLDSQLMVNGTKVDLRED